MPVSLPDQILDRVAARFRVLGDTTRLRILKFLLLEGELNVGQLVRRLDTSQANASKHLRALLDAGIVHRRTHGTAAFYSVADESIVTLCELVSERIRVQAKNEANSLSA